MGDVHTHLLGPLTALYGQPKRDRSEHVEVFYREYAKALSGFTDEELALAKNILRDQHGYNNWPLVPECIKACEGARRIIRAREISALVVENRPPPRFLVTSEQRKFVDDAADGKIELGVLSNVLRRMAKAMRAKRKSA